MTIDGTGHPRNHGFAQCSLCNSWRRGELAGGYCGGTAWSYCVREQSRRLPVTVEDGWDANGAPTGVDSNGDAT